MGIETNGAPPLPEQNCVVAESQSPENSILVQSMTTGPSCSQVTPTSDATAAATAHPLGLLSTAASLSNLHGRLKQECTGHLFSSQKYSLVNGEDTSIATDSPPATDNAGGFIRTGGGPIASSPTSVQVVVAGDNNVKYLSTASESSATNCRKYAITSPPPSAPVFSAEHRAGSRATDLPSSTPAKHFRFSGDFTSFRNSSVLSAFASSMGNLSDAWDDEDRQRTHISTASPKSKSPSLCSANSILPDLPTRFSFESSSTTSSSSSHLSLLQKPTSLKKIYQRQHGGSFDRKDKLTSLSTFQTHCEDFESYISTQRYGSVEKLMSYGYAACHGRPIEESTKGPSTDVSSLSLSPINRKRDLLGPSISL